MPCSRRCKYITQPNRLVLWIIRTTVVLNRVVPFGKHGRKGETHTEGFKHRWVYEITEVQAVFIHHQNPKLRILA